MARLTITPQKAAALGHAEASVYTPSVNVVVATATPGTDSPAVNEVQTVTVTNVGGLGTYTLTYSGQTTAGISPDATGAQVKAALVALSNIGANDVNVVRSGAGTVASPYVHTVTFVGALAATNVDQMTVTLTGLTLGVAIDNGGGAQGTSVRIKNNAGSQITLTAVEDRNNIGRRLRDESVIIPASKTHYLGEFAGTRFGGALNLNYARTGDLTFEVAKA